MSPLSFCGGWSGVDGWVCTVIFVSNPTTVLSLCWVVTIILFEVYLECPNSAKKWQIICFIMSSNAKFVTMDDQKYDVGVA